MLKQSRPHAFDRSLRQVDADGHMVVEMSRISKANICEYLGKEIPDNEALGLDPNKRYKLFRDPKELESGTRDLPDRDGKLQPTKVGAWSFDGKPLLIRHIPITAELPHKDLWVGTLGACTFEAPYVVTRPLNVITAEAQELIESEEQRELSAGYRYKADMTPGVYKGERYDGRMTNIQGNHVAIVSTGRAGPDVLVADELNPELSQMKNHLLIARLQKKIPALAGLSSADLLALDAELGEVPAKSTVMLSKDEEKSCLDEALKEKRKAEGEDSELSDEEKEAALAKARDKKARDAKEEKGEDEEEEGEDEEEEGEDEEEEGEDEEEEGHKASMKGKDKKAKDKRGKDSAPDHRKDFNSIKQGKDKRGHDSGITMDQAEKLIKVAVRRATTATAARVREEVTEVQRALAVAVDEVSPLVGKVQIHAFDSAEEVYAFALEKSGVEVDNDFPAAGLRALVKNEVKHRAAPRKQTGASRYGMDSRSGFDPDALFQKVG